jgi:hypothetical protein
LNAYVLAIPFEKNLGYFHKGKNRRGTKPAKAKLIFLQIGKPSKSKNTSQFEESRKKFHLLKNSADDSGSKRSA